jgi:hypothetical protein
MRQKENLQEFFACSYCGANSLSREAIQKRKSRGSDRRICLDCSAAKKTTLAYGDLICKPWAGDLDLDTLAPLKNGLVFMPGERLCGHKDCVEPSHILGQPSAQEKNLIAEQHDISYRTKRKKNYDQLVKTIKKERDWYGLLHANN